MGAKAGDIHDEPKIVASIRREWRAWHRAVVLVAIVAMVLAGAVWLSYQFWRLVLDESMYGAVDLRIRYAAVREWFAGVNVYRSPIIAAYDPPATYALLWPFMGWIDNQHVVRWVWALTAGGALTALSWLLVRHSGARASLDRTFVALLPATGYAAGATIGNGQLGLYVLCLSLAACLLAARPHGSAARDVLIGLLFLGALAKPTMAAPFFWILVFVPRSIWPATCAAGGYVCLTLVAASFHPTDFDSMLSDMFTASQAMASDPVAGNVANIQIWLGRVGLEAWSSAVSLALLLALGGWIYRHRRVDIWLLLGVTGYVGRLWTYHRWYDDVLILLPLVALLRTAYSPAPRGGSDVVAGLVGGATAAVALAPGGLFLLPPPLNSWFVVAQILIWMTGLLVLAAETSRRGHTGVSMLKT